TGEVLIHPFDHPDIVTGQGTVGLEILEQVPDVRTVVVPIGGGGLAAGIAVALAGTGVRLVGVQASGAAAYPASLAPGRPVPVKEMATMADGIAIACPGDTPFGLLRAAACEVVTVGEEDLSRALLHVLERSKMVVEPSGAAGVAALMAGLPVQTPAVVVLSGGNVDPLLLLRVVRHGLAAAGRYLQLRVRVADTPGHLAELLTDIATAGGNVLHVAHEREVADLAVDEVQIGVQVETRGADHAEELLAVLRDAGYRLT
ncbi:MAG TPA: pyridoxal-phosphate dependent enzyme, partial [Actinotalea sp.]|nr:pyridoxal-phosphate dependent enzyme [Actinotalea sp.]